MAYVIDLKIKEKDSKGKILSEKKIMLLNAKVQRVTLSPEEGIKFYSVSWDLQKLTNFTMSVIILVKIWRVGKTF